MSVFSASPIVAAFARQRQKLQEDEQKARDVDDVVVVEEEDEVMKKELRWWQAGNESASYSRLSRNRFASSKMDDRGRTGRFDNSRVLSAGPSTPIALRRAGGGVTARTWLFKTGRTAYRSTISSMAY
jgi:hypothetical protein